MKSRALLPKEKDDEQAEDETSFKLFFLRLSVSSGVSCLAQMVAVILCPQQFEHIDKSRGNA